MAKQNRESQKSPSSSTKKIAPKNAKPKNPAPPPVAASTPRGPKPGIRGAPGRVGPSTSGLSAAHTVLSSSKAPMNVRDLTETVLKRRLWSTSGRTPSATIAAAILREIKTKGNQSRFARAGRGLFEARRAGVPAAPTKKTR